MSARTRAMVGLAIALGSLSLAACDPKAPPRDTLSGWPPGEPVAVGSCAFVLHEANLWHSTEWHLVVEVSAENTGPEPVYCGFSAQALTESDTALTDADRGGTELAPGLGDRAKLHPREADVTGMSTGPAEGAWVYVELSEGRWPMAETHGVRVDPDRVRPP